MPIFEYKCSSCGVVEEFLESASSKNKHDCSKCGKSMQKMFSTFAPRIAAEKSGCAKNSCCPNAGHCSHAR